MRVRIGLLAICIGISAVASLQAVTYVHMDDRHLADRSELIARVEVVEARVTVTENQEIFSDYTVLVEDLVKGFVDGAYLTVRVPGGYSDELGLVLDYPGAPEFHRGNRALLFLNQNAGGTYRVAQFFLGNFREETVDSSSFFVRDIPEPANSDPRVKIARDADRFASWLRDRASGLVRDADYFAAVPKAKLASEVFSFTLRDPGYIAWSEFHNSPPQQVKYKRHKSGQKGVKKKGKKVLIQTAKALNKVKTTGGADMINLKVKGSFSTAKIPLSPGTCVSTNVIVFNDERGFINDPFSCTFGGILAVGGSCRRTVSSSQWKDRPLFDAASGRVIFNENTECFYDAASGLVEGSSSAPDTAEARFGTVAIHELIHTLGVKHSCGDDESPKCSKSEVLNDATMRASVHKDGRGASVRADDIAALRQLYDFNFFAAGCDVEPGHKNFCKRCGPCGEGQGKCKKNNQCFDGLTCKSDPSLGYKTCQ